MAGCTIADGHLGLWAALGEQYPTLAEQRGWNHKITNVLDAMPKKHQAEARSLLCTMPYAETQAACEVRHFRLHRSALAAQASSPERQKRRRIFHAVNIVQGLAIFVVVAVLTPMGHSEWIPASVMCVVGLHFLPRHGGRAV